MRIIVIYIEWMCKRTPIYKLSSLFGRHNKEAI